jgi:hypothetical protein
MKFLIASLKTLLTVILKIVPKTALNICSGFLLLSLVDFFQVYTFIAGFRENFQHKWRVTDNFLETQVAIRQPEQAL